MIKEIKHPTLDSAKEMTAPELNAIHFSPKKTLLSPEKLKKFRKG